MSSETLFVCKGCHEANNLDDLTEVEEDKEDHSHFICPNCEGRKFWKRPGEQPQQEPPDPPEPPEDAPEPEPPKEPTMDQERERKRQSWVRSLERSGGRR